MAKLVKKGTKGAVGEIVTTTTGPESKPVEGIAEIDFGTPGAAPSKRPKGKYPEISGAKIEKLADRIIELQDKFDAVADPFKAAKLELIELGFPQFFTANMGKIEAPSSMLAYGTKGGVRVTFKDKFTAGDKTALEKLLGKDRAAKWFKQQWLIKINGDLIPLATAPALITELREVMDRHGVSHAMEIKSAIMPNEHFAAQRHHAFDISTNLAINEIVPQQAAVTAKGVR